MHVPCGLNFISISALGLFCTTSLLSHYILSTHPPPIVSKKFHLWVVIVSLQVNGGAGLVHSSGLLLVLWFRYKARKQVRMIHF